jgi:hypothetical protein
MKNGTRNRGHGTGTKNYQRRFAAQCDAGPNMPLFLKRGWGDLAPQRPQRKPKADRITGSAGF